MPSIVTGSEYAIYWIGLAGCAVFAVIVTIISRMK
jgi:cytochrome oxidase assembly protein ShyY1